MVPYRASMSHLRLFCDADCTALSDPAYISCSKTPRSGTMMPHQNVNMPGSPSNSLCKHLLKCCAVLDILYTTSSALLKICAQRVGVSAFMQSESIYSSLAVDCTTVTTSSCSPQSNACPAHQALHVWCEQWLPLLYQAAHMYNQTSCYVNRQQ